MQKETSGGKGLDVAVGSNSPAGPDALSEQTPPPKGGKQPPSKEIPSPPHSLPFANTSGAQYPPRLQKSGSSSLATNLASARGIQLPGSSRVPGSQSPNRRRSGIAGERAGGQALSTGAEPSSAKPTTSPLMLLPPDEPPKKRKEPGEEDPFNRFYSTFNTFVSRIGSPFAASLAFAGLPLVEGEDEDKDREAKRTVLPKSWVEKYGRGRGLEKGWPTGDGGGESFYVVPVSGGTLSYAGVLRRDTTSPPPLPATSQSYLTEDFESINPKTLRHSRAHSGENQPFSRHTSPVRSRNEHAQLAGHSKTKEELQLENTGLRQTIDHMSRTMQSWQRKTKESENMLKNSIMAFSKNTGNPNSAEAGIDILNQVQRKSWLHVPYDEPDDNEYSEGRHVGELEWEREREREKALEDHHHQQQQHYHHPDNSKDERIASLERELESVKSKHDKLAKENEKLARVVQKFRERWDKLKEGARNKRSSSSAAGGAGGGTGSQLSRVEEGD